MDDSAIIAKQQREIEDLKERIGHALQALDGAHMLMVCVGGPLNDDRLGCTKEQRLEFYRVNLKVEDAIEWLRPEGC